MTGRRVIAVVAVVVGDVAQRMKTREGAECSNESVTDHWRLHQNVYLMTIDPSAFAPSTLQCN